MSFDSPDYKDSLLDQGSLTAKEIQLLMLQELRGVNKKLLDLDLEMKDVSIKAAALSEHARRLDALDKTEEKRAKEIEDLTRFKTQAITVIVVINILWGIAIAIFNIVN